MNNTIKKWAVVSVAATMLTTSVMATIPMGAHAAESVVATSAQNSNAITAPQLLNVTKDGFSGKYGSNIASVKLIVNGKVSKVATLSNGTYSFSGLLSGKQIRSTDIVSVIGYNAFGSEMHELEMEPGYADDVVIPPVVASINSYSITAPDSLSLSQSALSGNYGSDIASVKLIVEGRVAQVATLSNGTYTFNNLLNGQRVRVTDDISVIGYNAQGQEMHQISFDDITK
ncbi:immunoglobulin-like domain-containing protein [Paenilisteria newyorkensis]|uniref:immunoglobulin-like domain-containing protein n=1 Tax=Listeria newyorkensis TaxID=1497681 RepID=UPI00066A0D0E|nr:immunoglobulin-like domain-containing protein [Listeria newyorkensis]KMT57829.1 hypothetical protein X559_3242 [Listeria newyorkensis]